MGLLSSLAGLAGTAGGAFLGGPVGAAIGGGAGSMLGSMIDGGKGINGSNATTVSTTGPRTAEGQALLDTFLGRMKDGSLQGGIFGQGGSLDLNKQAQVYGGLMDKIGAGPNWNLKIGGSNLALQSPGTVQQLKLLNSMMGRTFDQPMAMMNQMEKNRFGSQQLTPMAADNSPFMMGALGTALGGMLGKSQATPGTENYIAQGFGGTNASGQTPTQIMDLIGQGAGGIGGF